MKKPYFHIKAICVVVFMLLQQTSFAQEVETQQETNTDVTNVTEDSENTAISEQAQSDVLNAAARAGNGIDELHWESITPTSVASIISANKSNNSVDLSTGKVNIQVPIATVGTSDIQVPIGLNYSTGGIKLRDVASWVGLGWNLSAGGKITRVLNRYPDTFGWSIDSLLDITTWTLTNDNIGLKGNFDARLKNQNADTQPDLFYFEIPGKSGMFVLDNQGKAATIPYQNIKINYDQAKKTFEIIDDVGTRYLFNDIETTEVRTEYVSIDRPNIAYESAWYLTEICSIKGDVVNFEYKMLYTTGETQKTYSYMTTSRSWTTTSSYDGSLSQAKYETIIDPLYLTKISWSNGRMEFISSKNRADFPTEAFQLDQIKLYSDPTEGILLKSYNFGYSAFANKSLKLDGINVSTPKSTTPEFFRKFEYFTDISMPNAHSSYSLEHYFEHDHWGFYNGKTYWNDDGVPAFRIRDGSRVIYKDSFDDRSASLLHCRAHSLKKIWVTSSGYNEFEYELNTSKYEFDPYDVNPNTIAPVGGLRIKSITTKSTELGDVAQKVRYEYTDEDGTSSGIVFNKIDYHHTGGFQGPTKYFIVSGSSVRSLFDLDGSHIRYGRIKELFDNGSSNTYKFTTKLNRPDSGYCKALSFWEGAYYLNPHESLTSKRNDFAPVNTRFWQRGLLTEKVSKDATGKETYKESYEYNFNAPIKKTIHCLFPFTGETSTGDIDPGLELNPVIIVYPYLVYYDYISQPIYMTKKTVVGVDFPQITTDYEYDDKDGNTNDLDHVLLKKKIETSSAGEFVTTYKYPFDYISSGPQDGHVLQFMRQHNISSAPIEVVKYKNDHVIGGELYLYANWKYMYNGSITGGTYFNLREVKELLLRKPILASAFRESVYTGAPQGYRFLYDNNYVTKAAYEYNRSNKLGCVKERNKPSQSVIYDDSKTLPIAQATNAEAKILSGAYHEEVLHTSFEDDNGREHSKAKTGSKVLNGSYYIRTINLVPGVYAVSYWVSKNDGVDWELYEHEMNVIANQDREYRIGGSGIIDELRVHKKDAQMQTRTYDLNKNVTSETDANGKTTYYEYDAFGRLITVLDNNHNKLKSYDYYIKK